MTEHAVVIAGGGPTGMTLAGELALVGIDVAVVERRRSQKVLGGRAGGLHSRTIQMFEQRGIAERFLTEGQVAQVAGFAWFPLDISDIPTRHNYGLALRQEKIERILARRVEELGVPVYRDREVSGFSQSDTCVNVELASGSAIRAGYLVGCDGGRSVVRKAAGIGFAGWDPTVSHLIAEVRMREEPAWGMHRDAFGIHSLSPNEGSHTVRVLLTEEGPGRKGEPTLQDLRERLMVVYGSDFGVHSPVWISRFTDMARQAVSYRKGRVLVAGDAAHVHYPTGGQGLNTGVQDAMNLGWKLAQVVKGISPDGLLDTYHAERHPVAAAVLRTTMAQVALLRSDDRTEALRETMSGLLAMDGPRQRLGAMTSGLDIRYDLGDGHPLLGRAMPDLVIATVEGALRVSSLLHGGRPVLLHFGSSPGIDITEWSDRVQFVHAGYEGPWELPGVGAMDRPSAVLVRPDGYVAWVADGTDRSLRDALATWFGAPTIA